MKKSSNSIMLGILIGFAFSCLPSAGQMFAVVFTAGMLCNRWDEFFIYGGSRNE